MEPQDREARFRRRMDVDPEFAGAFRAWAEELRRRVLMERWWKGMAGFSDAFLDGWEAHETVARQRKEKGLGP